MFSISDITANVEQYLQSQPSVETQKSTPVCYLKSMQVDGPEIALSCVINITVSSHVAPSFHFWLIWMQLSCYGYMCVRFACLSVKMHVWWWFYCSKVILPILLKKIDKSLRYVIWDVKATEVKVKILVLFNSSHRHSQLWCYLLNLEHRLFFEHIVQSPRDMCVSGVHFLTTNFAIHHSNTGVQLRRATTVFLIKCS